MTNDIRIIISFFILKKLFNKIPFIYKFTKRVYEYEGVKFTNIYIVVIFQFIILLSFLF